MNRGYQSCTVDDLAEIIKKAGGECVFLVGAGCSKSAGIPLANELINEIKERHREFYDSSVSKSYNDLMGKLNVEDRDRLIINHIDKARINWAYLALAKLFLNNHTKRILTVNFDPLILRACSMLGCFPAVYDLAVSKTFNAKRIVAKSVFYLNGQHTGFVMLNGADELNEHKKTLEEIVRNTGGKIIWVVIGYSGEADPLSEVLNEMAKTSGFDQGLYWVDYSNEPSASQEKLLKNKNTYFLGGQDADGFLQMLALKLNCFPPSILTDPFDYVERIVTENINFETGGVYAKSIKSRMLYRLEKARGANPNLDVNTSNLMLSGRYQDVIDYAKEKPGMISFFNTDLAWAYLMMANDIRDKANSLASSGGIRHAKTLWRKSFRYYKISSKYGEDLDVVFRCWGVSLSDRGRFLSTVDGEQREAIDSWKMASGKYATSLKYDKNSSETLNNFANSLAYEGLYCLVSMPGRFLHLFSLAKEKYEQSLLLDAENSGTLFNYSDVLFNEAKYFRQKDVAHSLFLLKESIDKCKKALGINPSFIEASIKTSDITAFEAIIVAPSDLDRANNLWLQAKKGYIDLLMVIPESYHILFNLTYMLSQMASYSKDKNRESLLQEAKHYAVRASENIFYRMVGLHGVDGQVKECIFWLQCSQQYNVLPSKAYIDSDKSIDNVRNTPDFQVWYKGTFEGGVV